MSYTKVYLVSFYSKIYNRKICKTFRTYEVAKECADLHNAVIFAKWSKKDEL